MEEPNTEPREQEAKEQLAVYPLDEALIGMLADIRQQENQLTTSPAYRVFLSVSQQLQALQSQTNGALVLFIRQHKLPGNWAPAENGRELVRIKEQQT
jgi:hypothetical protein